MKLFIFMLVTQFAGTMAAAPVAPEDVVSIVITSVISASVLTAIVAGLFNFFISRRTARITERKNSVDAENDLVSRYREAAAEERAQKESAVETVKNLLNIAEAQVASLQGTISTLNNTITSMKMMSDTQQDLIDQLTIERDRMEDDLKVAQNEIDIQKELLIKRQQEILDLTIPKDEVDRIRDEMPESDEESDEDPDTSL